MIYDTCPHDPDPANVAKVTDYIMGYISKGCEQGIQEKKKMLGIIQNSETVTGDKSDVKKGRTSVIEFNIERSCDFKTRSNVLFERLIFVFMLREH